MEKALFAHFQLKIYSLKKGAHLAVAPFLFLRFFK
jgi:hypothetical protein